MTTTSLATATSPDVATTQLVLVPVGSLEQHGPHLPLDTDTVVATAVATRAAELLACDVTVLVAPPLPFGASGEHQQFPGTTSVGSAALHLVVMELVRSVGTWASRVIFVNGHGGNVAALQGAVGTLIREGHDTGWFACAAGEGDAHAGLTETSLMLHLRPDSVRLERAAAGNTAPIGQLLPMLRTAGVAAVSVNGVLGDPTGATPEAGEQALAAMVRNLSAAVLHGVPDRLGRLRARR